MKDWTKEQHLLSDRYAYDPSELVDPRTWGDTKKAPTKRVIHKKKQPTKLWSTEERIIQLWVNQICHEIAPFIFWEYFHQFMC